jgi:hypothetical protein
MEAASILNHIYHLPVRERILIAERTIHSIRLERRRTAKAVAIMAEEYCNDPELTAFTQLDMEDFYEAR